MNDVLNEKLALVSVFIKIFSGYRRATREDIAALGGSLPQSSAVTEGSIKVFPVGGINALATVRRQLFRKLQGYGVRAVGSANVFAVPTEALPEIEQVITDAKTQFEVATSALMACRFGGYRRYSFLI